MMRNALLLGLGVLLTVAFTAPTQETATLSAVPGNALETNPVGTLRWLPPTANEQATGFGNHRLIVTYDGSLNDAGEDTELAAKGPWAMKLFTTALVDGSTGQEFPLKMTGHSEFVESIDDGQGAPQEADELFMGLSGNVQDADCALLEDGDPSDFSAAYTTTRIMPTGYTTTACELAAPATDQDGNPLLDAEGNQLQEVTAYVPGFWVDVNWPYSTDALAGGAGHHFAELWYGALYDSEGTSGDWTTDVDSVANSTSVGGPHSFDFSFTLSANPGGWSAPECYDNLPQNAPNGFVEEVLDLSGYEGEDIRVSLWPKGDWDLFVEGPGGSASGAGGFIGFEETAKLAFTPGEWTVRGCNFAGEHDVLVTVSVED